MSERQQIVMGGALHVVTHLRSLLIVNAVAEACRKQLGAALNQGVAP